MKSTISLKPLSFAKLFCLFAVPTLVFSLSVLVWLPWLVKNGYSHFAVFNLAFILPLALLLVSAFIGLKLEGRSLSWPSIRDRFRLGKLPRHGWWWVLGLLVFNIVAGSVTATMLTNQPESLRLFTWPPELAGFLGDMHNVQDSFLGIPLLGNWWVFFYYLGVLFVFNILGEELWWRGLILPRQELTQGRFAWVFHGIMWDLFHLFYHQTLWSLIAYLPVTMSIAFVSQKVKNTWPAIIVHFVVNSGLLIIIFMKVMGL